MNKFPLTTVLSVFFIVHVANVWAADKAPDWWSTMLQQGGHQVTPDNRESMTVEQHADENLSALLRSTTMSSLPADANVVSEAERSQGGAQMLMTVFSSDGEQRVLVVSAAKRSGGGALTLAHIVRATDPNAAKRVSDAGALLYTSAMQGDSVGGPPENTVEEELSLQTAPTPTIQSAAANNSVEAVLFDLDYRYGVGGMAIANYSPVVLFTNGDACKCLQSAIDDIDIATVRKAHPRRVGRWQKAGAHYDVHYGGGAKVDTLKTDAAVPLPLTDNAALVGTYQAIGGGGNSALGGTATIAAIEDLTFAGDGRFTQSAGSVVDTDAAVGGAHRGRTGRWSLDGDVLTLDYDDGQRVRTTLYYSSRRKASADFGQYGVLWIGGEDFKRVR